MDYNIAWVLLTFLGLLGIHRFYMGKWFTGIVYLLSGGIFGLGYLYDLWTLNDQVSLITAGLRSGKTLMDKAALKTIECYMHSCMNDGAHDEQHIYRVLYAALDIASDHQIDIDVLIAAALLHDIGREAQFQDSKLDHAVVGADMAYHFLKHNGWSEDKAGHVRDCIRTHRYRNDRPPETLEAKILYDADKLDATGTMGIARTLITPIKKITR